MRAMSTLSGGYRPHGGLLQVRRLSPAWRAPTGQALVARMADYDALAWRSILAQESRSVTMRLMTGASGEWSLASAQK